MFKILILSHRQDEHGRCVTEALRQKGVLAIRWFSEEYLLDQKSSVHFEPIGPSSFEVEGINETKVINTNEIDVVWFRRPRYPLVPKYADPEDIRWINSENKMYLQALWLNLEQSAVWVNPLSSELRSRNKLYQLEAAAKLGLTIPETLISNSKNEISTFIEKNNLTTGTIYKPLSSPSWNEPAQNILPLTTVISAEQLPTQELLGLTPGIYQKRIPKAFEIRATFFGKFCIAVKIHNTEAIDWRPSQILKDLQISATTIPKEVYQQCLDLMEALGIIFGCFDFIITPEGKYVFLEVNEMGQWNGTHPSLNTASKEPKWLSCYHLRKTEGPMSNVTLLGVDLAKNLFQLHGVDEKGNPVLRRKLTRNKFIETITNLLLVLLQSKLAGEQIIGIGSLNNVVIR